MPVKLIIQEIIGHLLIALIAIAALSYLVQPLVK